MIARDYISWLTYSRTSSTRTAAAAALALDQVVQDVVVLLVVGGREPAMSEFSKGFRKGEGGGQGGGGDQDGDQVAVEFHDCFLVWCLMEFLWYLGLYCLSKYWGRLELFKKYELKQASDIYGREQSLDLILRSPPSSISVG